MADDRPTFDWEDLGAYKMMETGVTGLQTMVGGALVTAILTKGWGIDWLPFTTIMTLIYTYFCVKGDRQRNESPLMDIVAMDMLICMTGTTLCGCLTGILTLILRGQNADLLGQALETGLVCLAIHFFIRWIFDCANSYKKKSRN